MRDRLQIGRRFAGRVVLGAALMAMAFCFASFRAGAAPHNSHAVLRNASTASKTHHRRYRRSRYRRHHVTLPKAPSVDRTSEIQSALARGGYYTGDPNGKWDSRTQAALRRFQEANGLPPTGKLDALSLQKLGLGSDVAGVSAPRPLTSSNQNPPPSVPKSPGL